MDRGVHALSGTVAPGRGRPCRAQPVPHGGRPLARGLSQLRACLHLARRSAAAVRSRAPAAGCGRHGLAAPHVVGVVWARVCVRPRAHGVPARTHARACPEGRASHLAAALQRAGGPEPEPGRRSAACLATDRVSGEQRRHWRALFDATTLGGTVRQPVHRRPRGSPG